MGEAKRRQQTGKPSPHRVREQRRRWMFQGGSAIAVVGVVALVLWLVTPGSDVGSLPDADPDADPFPSELDRHGVSIGDADAPVVVREFADYQCPACARFHDSAHDRLYEQFIETGQVRLVFFDLPLPQHDNALPAAMAARCANDQGEFRAMQSRLFSQQEDWSRASDPREQFEQYAGDIGIDERRFMRCLNTEHRRSAVENSARVARQMQVRSTPSVLVDNIPISQPNWSVLSGVIERELDRQKE